MVSRFCWSSTSACGVLVAAVEDGGDLAGVTQAAARTFALRPRGVRAEGE